MNSWADLSRVPVCYRFAVLRGMILTAQSLAALQEAARSETRPCSEEFFKVNAACVKTHGLILLLRRQLANFQVSCPERAEFVGALGNDIS